LKLGYILSAQSQLGAGAAVFADEIAKRTEGRYQIEQYPNSALGGEVEMLKAVQLGTVDLAFITGAPLPNVLPDIGIFNIPFLFRDVSHAHAVLDGPIGQSYCHTFETKTSWLWPGAKMECDISPIPSARYARQKTLRD
jgi:TRAP-type C4-dicarboxylate transport system substrate-binding protein